MNPRLPYAKISPDTVEAFTKAAAHLGRSFSDHKLKALVELHVSQINGCAYCVDLHSNQARTLGETQQRLDCLAAWDEVSLYTDRERAALALAESITRVSETHVPDDVYEAAKTQFNEKELVDLIAIIALMNFWNRVSISFRSQPPDRGANA
jgi:uncharacterized peroxidase-related enzyme